MDKHKSSIIDKILHTNNHFSHTEYISFFLPVEKMDFLIRKIFKNSDIEYLYIRKDRRIIVNTDESPFRVAIRTMDDGYVQVRRIPIDEFEYNFCVRDPADLLRKMVDKRIITVRQFRKIIQTQKQERAIKREAMKYLVRK